MGEDPALSGEKFVYQIAQEMQEELGQFWDVQIERVNKTDVFTSVEQLYRIVDLEQKDGNNILINTTGALRILTIAGYIVASIAGVKIVSALPGYENEKELESIDQIIEIPTLPIELPTEEQLEILTIIGELVDSVDEIIMGLGKNEKKDELSKKMLTNERARMSHHLKSLEVKGLIVREKIGRKMKVRSTNTGKLILSLGNIVKK